MERGGAQGQGDAHWRAPFRSSTPALGVTESMRQIVSTMTVAVLLGFVGCEPVGFGPGVQDFVVRIGVITLFSVLLLTRFRLPQMDGTTPLQSFRPKSLSATLTGVL